MSRAFTREPDGDGIAVADLLPDRPISTHPNFVTARGLAAIEARVRELDERRRALAAVQARHELAEVEREWRYWSARRASAKLIEPPEAPEVVRFGVEVEFEFDDGNRRRFRIVGEDEADPAAGTISHISPLAKTLFGRRAGDSVTVSNREAQIIGLHR